MPPVQTGGIFSCRQEENAGQNVIESNLIR